MPALRSRTVTHGRNMAGARALLRAAGVAGAYFVAGRALRPLQQVTTTARALTGDTLDQRIRYQGADDEVAELANTFDAMMDRISATLDSHKRFVANASHELRTPLTVMRTEVEVTLADPDADLEEYRRMAKVVRDGSERANALIESLLLLARTEAQSGRRLSKKVPADLADCVTSALSAMSREIDRIHLTVEKELQPAPVVGDPGLLDRLAGNLIENAVRYNHLHGSIWVRTGGDDEQIARPDRRARWGVGDVGEHEEVVGVVGGQRGVLPAVDAVHGHALAGRQDVEPADRHGPSGAAQGRHRNIVPPSLRIRHPLRLTGCQPGAMSERTSHSKQERTHGRGHGHGHGDRSFLPALGHHRSVRLYDAFGLLIGAPWVYAAAAKAARLDGVNSWQMFWRITLPSIRPAMVVVIVAISIATLKVFDIVRTTTNGNYDTGVIANEMYNQAFRFGQTGQGSALAVFLFVLVIPLVIYQIRNLRKQREV